MKTKSKFWFVPNTITSLNVFSGSVAVVMAFNHQLTWAGGFILLAAFFDFFDGLSARLLNAYSDMGKELDSLADVVSFGFAPAAIIHVMVKNQVMVGESFANASVLQLVITFLPFIVVVFSALRLAKFNIDTRQSDSFIGLPTPANAMVWASFPFILAFSSNPAILSLAQNIWFILFLSIALSLLLVSEVPMFSLKFKSLNYKENQSRFLFLAGCMGLTIAFKITSIPLIILWYILLSVILNLLAKK